MALMVCVLHGDIVSNILNKTVREGHQAVRFVSVHRLFGSRHQPKTPPLLTMLLAS